MTQDLEKTLWAAADKLRNNMDAAEYKHIVLGLIFLKYISDRFEDLHQRLLQDPHADAEGKRGGQFYIQKSIV
jgi:type I restriction enzyme M protein